MDLLLNYISPLPLRQNTTVDGSLLLSWKLVEIKVSRLQLVVFPLPPLYDDLYTYLLQRVRNQEEYHIKYRNGMNQWHFHSQTIAFH